MLLVMFVLLILTGSPLLQPIRQPSDENENNGDPK
jgi:hypothetical protein